MASKKSWASAIGFSLIALTFVVSAGSSAWYYQSIEVQIPFFNQTTSYFISYGLDEVHLFVDTGNGSASSTISYDDEALESEGLGPVFNVASSLITLSIILLVLMIITSIVAVIKKGKGAAVSMFFGVLVIIVLLSSVAYITYGVPSAFDATYEPLEGEEDLEKPGYTNSFFGSEDYFTWGGSVGWYEAVLAIICMLLSVIFMRIASKQARGEEARGIQMWTHDEDPRYKKSMELDVEAEVVTETLTLECPGCREKFKAEIGDRPAKIKCPHCGVEGDIK